MVSQSLLTSRETIEFALPHLVKLSNQQLSWLDNQNLSHSLAHQDEDPTFWPSLFKKFFKLWPVRHILWPHMPRDLALTEVEQRLVTEGEDQLKAYITAFFELNRILSNTEVATHVAHWSIEQFDWLNDKIDWYLSVVFDAELRFFWPAVFEFFFVMWPVYEVLWPTMSASQVLTGIQQHFVSAAEEQCKLCIKAFFRTHAYSYLVYL
ncbi:hypothetical protein EDD22DRAFT_959165 [Suillus occidentalis]|nr:hypothetical protein EDD22DRAFT_959165 [Suillus occidentalis]